MNKFEYQITLHPADKFNQVAYFCSTDGTCNLEQVPRDQVSVLAALLNEKGQSGWELVQISFGRGGVMAFWKRPIA